MWWRTSWPAPPRMWTCGPADHPMQSVDHPRPVPVRDARSAGFWEAAAGHRLAVQRCENCSWLSYPPDAICARCLSPDGPFVWHPVSGRGTLRAWTTVRTAFLPGFAPYVPYVVAAVELAEQGGLRVVARMASEPESTLVYGAPVETVFDDVADGLTIPMFRLLAS
jgi:uncharacterized protein